MGMCGVIIRNKNKKAKVPWQFFVMSSLSGFLNCIAFTFEKLDLFVFIAFVPMIMTMEFYKDYNYRMTKPIFIYTVSYYLSNILWLYNMCPIMENTFSFTVTLLIMTLAILAISVLQGMIFVISFSPFNQLKKAKFPIFVIFPVLYVFAEFLQEHAWEFSFPWGRIGTILAFRPVLIQGASLFGSLFVSFVIVLFNSLIAKAAVMLIKTKNYKQAVMFFCIAIVLFLSNAVYGVILVSNIEKVRKDSNIVKVAIIQANFNSRTKWSMSHLDSLKSYKKLSDKACEENPDIYLWPETAVTMNIHDRETLSYLKRFAKEKNATLVTGILDGENNEYNTLAVVRADGVVPKVYYKRELVPMGEYVPFSEVIPESISTQIGNMVAGTEATTLDTLFGKAGGLICYESIYPYVARESTVAGAEYFLMVSNDSWFGESSALRQHLCHAIMRCVENKKDMARAGNTGISAIISSSGAIEKFSCPNSEEVIVGNLVPNSSRSLYSYIGDLIILPCIIIFIIGVYFKIKCLVQNKKYNS